MMGILSGSGEECKLKVDLPDLEVGELRDKIAVRIYCVELAKWDL